MPPKSSDEDSEIDAEVEVRHSRSKKKRRRENISREYFSSYANGALFIFGGLLLTAFGVVLISKGLVTRKFHYLPLVIGEMSCWFGLGLVLFPLDRKTWDQVRSALFKPAIPRDRLRFEDIDLPRIWRFWLPLTIFVPAVIGLLTIRFLGPK